MKGILILGVLVICILIYNYIQISKFYVNKIVLYSTKISKELRITQISDYHANYRIDKEKLLNDIKKFNPHIIVLTGDLIDSRTKNIEPTLDFIKSIMAINKNIFYVNGNHELNCIFGDKFISSLEIMGVNVLVNTGETIDINGERINICGVSFYTTKKEYEDSLKHIDEQNYTILLSHSPNRPIYYMTGKEDLIICGHTHGGQVRLPFIGAIIAPGQGYFPKYDKGIFELGNNTILYIDSGLGNSVFPIRAFNRIQISNITIKGNNN
ncbi:MAG: metallophosphoesterase [Tissierellia bacterium]|nr:metallophosphoesterase [Tissierellia bacterium]